jgi:hypothetical protein
MQNWNTAAYAAEPGDIQYGKKGGEAQALVHEVQRRHD